MFGSRIIELETAESTNNYALQLIKIGEAKHGMVVSTDNQWGGRGRSNRKWDSLKGQNLTISVILSPRQLPVEHQFALSQAIALGILSFLKSEAPDESFRIKWPNDIFHQSNKISGILIENLIFGNSFEFAVVGIGINLNQTEFSPGILNPGSLRNITGKPIDRKNALLQLLRSLEHYYRKLEGMALRELQEEYLANLYLFDKEAKFESDSGVVNGRISGVDEFGRLILMESDGATHHFLMDEIKYLH